MPTPSRWGTCACGRHCSMDNRLICRRALSAPWHWEAVPGAVPAQKGCWGVCGDCANLRVPAPAGGRDNAPGQRWTSGCLASILLPQAPCAGQVPPQVALCPGHKQSPTSRTRVNPCISDAIKPCIKDTSQALHLVHKQARPALSPLDKTLHHAQLRKWQPGAGTEHWACSKLCTAVPQIPQGSPVMPPPFWHLPSLMRAPYSDNFAQAVPDICVCMSRVLPGPDMRVRVARPCRSRCTHPSRTPAPAWRPSSASSTIRHGPMPCTSPQWTRRAG